MTKRAALRSERSLKALMMISAPIPAGSPSVIPIVGLQGEWLELVISRWYAIRLCRAKARSIMHANGGGQSIAVMISESPRDSASRFTELRR